MTYDQINIKAYDEARRHFVSMILAGYRLDSAYEKREEVFEVSKRARCTFCLVEKHLSKFYDKGPGPQCWCIECQLENTRLRSTTNRERWAAVKASA